MRTPGHREIFASDVDWRPGQSDGVSFAWFSTDDDNPKASAIILSRFAANAVVAPHTHDSNYFEYIIEGEQTVGKVTFRTGDVRIVKGGVGYGPIHVGPQGCTVIIVFEDKSGAMTQSLPRRKTEAVVSR
jgi:anti-sigma factor ChrR (cupin superfamily)